MNRTTSIYLDAIRFLAALAVYLGHMNDWSGKKLNFFTPTISAQAVIVFFLLSGFVIAYVTDNRRSNWIEYSASRMARIYSVAIPTLFLTFFVDYITIPLPNVHEDNLTGSTSPIQFLSGLLFINEVWGRHIPIGSNSPYWSLGYEVPYYICFGIFLFAKARWRWLALVALIAFGPRVAIFFLIWLMGIGVYYVCKNQIVSIQLGRVILLSSIIIWPAFNFLNDWSTTPLYWHSARDLPGDFLIAILFASNIIGVDAISRSGSFFSIRQEAVIRWLAGSTFTLYLMHTPIARLTNEFMPFQISNLSGIIFISFVVFIATFFLAPLTEKKKSYLQLYIREKLRSVYITISNEKIT